jgi:hypothetical protein
MARLSTHRAIRSFIILGTVVCCGPLVVAACSSDDASGGAATNAAASPDGGDAASAQQNDDTNTNDGDSGSTTPPPDGGTDSSTPAGTGLGTDDGIVATVAGTALVFKTQVVHIPQGNDSLVLGARTSDYASVFTIHMKSTLGPQDCTGGVGTDDIYLSLAKAPDYENGGTTASPGTCTINLTSVTPKIEGTFVASLNSGNTPKAVTDGAFRFTP